MNEKTNVELHKEIEEERKLHRRIGSAAAHVVERLDEGRNPDTSRLTRLLREAGYMDEEDA